MSTNPLLRDEEEAQAVTEKEEEEMYPELARQGKIRRYKAFVRAIYAEFMGTFLFLLPVFGILANAHNGKWDGQMTLFMAAFVTALNAIGVIFCFSSLSGSQLNPAISFGLWIVGHLSNRRFVAFSVAQLLGALAVMLAIKGCFPHADADMFNSFVLTPEEGANKGNVFCTEFLMSFFLTFVAFAIAFEEQTSSSRASAVSLQAMQDDTLVMYSTTPQSKSGFAPFAIGFILFGIVTFGGGSGVGLNPVRMLAPAMVANKWTDLYVYLFGQYIGAGVAALVVTYGPQSAKRDMNDLQESIKEVPREIAQRLKFIGKKVRGAQ